MKYLCATTALFLLTTMGSDDSEPGCGEGGGDDSDACAAYATSGLGVVVEHADTRAHICDATVTAADGDYSETLLPAWDAPGDKDCGYPGAAERPGTYRVEASKDGFVTAAEDDVVVTKGECHVETVSLTLVLTPS